MFNGSDDTDGQNQFNSFNAWGVENGSSRAILEHCLLISVLISLSISILLSDYRLFCLSSILGKKSSTKMWKVNKSNARKQKIKMIKKKYRAIQRRQLMSTVLDMSVSKPSKVKRRKGVKTGKKGIMRSKRKTASSKFMQIENDHIIYCINAKNSDTCRIYPKYSNTSTPYHVLIPTTCTKYNLLPNVVSKNCWMSGKQCRPWWDVTFCGISSGFTLFAYACLSEYIL